MVNRDKDVNECSSEDSGYSTGNAELDQAIDIFEEIEKDVLEEEKRLDEESDTIDKLKRERLRRRKGV